MKITVNSANGESAAVLQVDASKTSVKKYAPVNGARLVEINEGGYGHKFTVDPTKIDEIYQDLLSKVQAGADFTFEVLTVSL